MQRAFEVSLQLAAGAPPGDAAGGAALGWAASRSAGSYWPAIGPAGPPADQPAAPLAAGTGTSPGGGSGCSRSAWALYVGTVLGGRLPAPEEYAPAAYIGAVRLRSRWEALAQLRTGSHWLGEETGRWARCPGSSACAPREWWRMCAMFSLNAPCTLLLAIASPTRFPPMHSVTWPHFIMIILAAEPGATVCLCFCVPAQAVSDASRSTAAPAN